MRQGRPPRLRLGFRHAAASRAAAECVAAQPAFEAPFASALKALTSGDVAVRVRVASNGEVSLLAARGAVQGSTAARRGSTAARRGSTAARRGSTAARRGSPRARGARGGGQFVLASSAGQTQHLAPRRPALVYNSSDGALAPRASCCGTPRVTCPMMPAHGTVTHESRRLHSAAAAQHRGKCASTLAQGGRTRAGNGFPASFLVPAHARAEESYLLGRQRGRAALGKDQVRAWLREPARRWRGGARS
jgi:hypothetical protein